MGDDTFEGIGSPADDALNQLNEINIINKTTMRSTVDELVNAALRARRQELTRGKGDTVEGWVSREDAEWIQEHFQRFYDRPLGAGVTIGSNLNRARTTMEGGNASVFAEASGALNQWAGDARDDFQRFFVNKFPGAMKNQLTILEGMRVGMFSYEGIQRSGRADAKEIAEAATKQLDAIANSSFASAEAKFVYTMAGVAAWIAGTVAGGAPALVLAMTLIGASSFAANGVAGYSTSKDAIAGTTVADVLESVVDKLNKLQELMYTEEEQLAAAFEADNDWVGNQLGHSDPDATSSILPHEPSGGPANLTDGEMPSREDFRPKQ